MRDSPDCFGERRGGGGGEGRGGWDEGAGAAGRGYDGETRLLEGWSDVKVWKPAPSKQIFRITAVRHIN